MTFFFPSKTMPLLKKKKKKEKEKRKKKATPEKMEVCTFLPIVSILRMNTNSDKSYTEPPNHLLEEAVSIWSGS